MSQVDLCQLGILEDMGFDGWRWGERGNPGMSQVDLCQLGILEDMGFDGWRRGERRNPGMSQVDIGQLGVLRTGLDGWRGQEILS